MTNEARGDERDEVEPGHSAEPDARPSTTSVPLRETEPYPAALRPTFDIPVSAPVSTHAPVNLQRVSARSTRVTSPAEHTIVGTTGHTPLHAEDSRPPRGDDEQSPAGSHTSSSPRPRGRGRPVAVIVLATLLVLTLGGGTYLAVLSNEWEGRSAEWEAQARTLGGDVADLTGDIAGMTSELTIVRDQLITAQARITELADEKAQVGDDRESQKILADDVQEVAETALLVSAALGDCVTAQKTVLGYLAAPETTTPEVIQTAVTQSDTVCTVAVADYNSLLKDLAAT